MREPKVGDKIVVTRADDVEVTPQITEVVDLEKDPGLLHIDPPIEGVDSEARSRLVRYPSGRADIVSEEVDEWRYAVRKGDRLVVTKMCGKSVEPTIVEAEEDEEEAGGLIWLSNHVTIPDNRTHNVLSLGNLEDDIVDGGVDEWHFAEEFVSEHGIPATYISDNSIDINGGKFMISRPDGGEPIADICSSFNECEPEYYVEKDSFGQSFSEFNAAHGGGKTLKDYTGVDITPETLGFVSDRDKTIQGITAESLAFEESVDNVNHPSHYNYGDIEVIDFIEQVADSYEDGSVAYMLGNTIKYVSRAPHKNGVEDLRKAAFYLNRAIERMEDTK